MDMQKDFGEFFCRFDDLYFVHTGDVVSIREGLGFDSRLSKDRSTFSRDERVRIFDGVSDRGWFQWCKSLRARRRSTLVSARLESDVEVAALDRRKFFQSVDLGVIRAVAPVISDGEKAVIGIDDRTTDERIRRDETSALRSFKDRESHGFGRS